MKQCLFEFLDIENDLHVTTQSDARNGTNNDNFNGTLVLQNHDVEYKIDLTIRNDVMKGHM